MSSRYSLPEIPEPPRAKPNEVLLVANGDLRLSANQTCWPTQEQMERELKDAVKSCGFEVVRAHPYKPEEKHGFIGSQKEGMKVFEGIDPEAKLIVAEAVWQYSHHILHGLMFHKGPILLVANWSGKWPGLVGMLNLAGCLTKADVKYSMLWSEDFRDPEFRAKLSRWLQTGEITHKTDHVIPFERVEVPREARELGEALARQLLRQKAIMGVFDEGCMGMYNAIIPDHLLNPTGVFKERLSQSALYYATTQVPDEEAEEVYRWLLDKGMRFELGTDEATELTESQVLTQCKMYIAALRIADEFGCDVIGIQYQQGLKDLLPASDLVEGLLNNTDRPPVRSADGERVLYEGEPLPHFNEVDECSGLDALMTYRVHKSMGQPVETTLHDIRWGDWDRSGTTDEYVWVFEISGAVPPEHLKGGDKGAISVRQPAMYFRLGGGSIKGVSKPGEIVWSRIYIERNQLCMDLGRAAAIDLPEEETRRRSESTTPEWPIMHAVLYGVDRDQMMAKHKSNHIQVVYATDAESADEALLAKASMASALGMKVNICGTRKDGESW
ncbi:MAG: fucose isomerase [Candidatus Thorarchaeota archaeon]